MQYYFARTGLLDGKGGQLARKTNTRSGPAVTGRQAFGAGTKANQDSVLVIRDGSPGQDDDKENIDHDALHLTEEPVCYDEADSGMLPPTVSTYRVKAIVSQPPPDIMLLREDLVRSLAEARQAVDSLSDVSLGPHIMIGEDPTDSPTSDDEHQGWHEIQGLHILDVVTLAIRAAKDYYTFHPRPQTLYSIRSEREIRSDLYQALETLKRMANRNFRGGVRNAEQVGMLKWIDGITHLLQKEKEIEERQEALRSQWEWLQGDWTGRERERESLFLAAFDKSEQGIPAWQQPQDNEPTHFLKAMSSGLRLIQLHNELVNQSRRRFGTITSFYTDLGKPYRCADNLRYWVKAAELRWQVRLQIDVLDIVYNRGIETWKKFDQAILSWSQAVRQELSDEWLEDTTRRQSIDLPSPMAVEEETLVCEDET